jgi:hypothetical protein
MYIAQLGLCQMFLLGEKLWPKGAGADIFGSSVKRFFHNFVRYTALTQNFINSKG